MSACHVADERAVDRVRHRQIAEEATLRRMVNPSSGLPLRRTTEAHCRDRRTWTMRASRSMSSGRRLVTSPLLRPNDNAAPTVESSPKRCSLAASRNTSACSGVNNALSCSTRWIGSRRVSRLWAVLLLGGGLPGRIGQLRCNRGAGFRNVGGCGGRAGLGVRHTVTLSARSAGAGTQAQGSGYRLDAFALRSSATLTRGISVREKGWVNFKIRLGRSFQFGSDARRLCWRARDPVKTTLLNRPDATEV